MNAELEVFSRIPANILRPWLQAQRANGIKYLLEAVDPVVIHRAQGKVQFIDTQLELLEKSQNSR